MKLKRKAIVIHNGDYVEHLLKLGEQSQEPSELIKKYLKEYKQDIKDNRFNWEIFDDLLISKEQARKELRKRIKELNLKSADEFLVKVTINEVLG